MASLLSESRADRDDRRTGYARPLAAAIIRQPELAERLQPDSGKFHRKIIACIQTHPKLTPEIRGRLAQCPHVCAYLL